MTDSYVTVSEVAKHFRVHKMTIYRAIQDGHIRYVKVGRQFRIPVSEFKRLMREGL